MKDSSRFKKAVSFLESADDTLTYCLTRKLRTSAGKNVLWNVKNIKYKLRNVLTLLKKVDVKNDLEQIEMLEQTLKSMINKTREKKKICEAKLK